MDEQAHYACARARISTYGALGVWIDQLGRALPSQVLARREKEFGIVTNDLFVYESARQAQAFLVLARSFCEARRAGMDFT